MAFVVATFYHFFDFAEVAATRKALLEKLNTLGIKGSLLLAAEGINGTLAGTRSSIDEALSYIKKVTGEEFAHKESLSENAPFKRTKVRLKKEIISFNYPLPLREGAGGGAIPPTLPSPSRGEGKRVAPKDWNALVDDPDVLLLDARNAYEVHLGTFKNAVDPGVRTFKQLPQFVDKQLDPKRHKKIATFCTGGIRCEKLSSWLLQQGFAHVYQLDGGILKYLEEIPENESKWQGECYVFDERVAVGHGLAASATATMCKACGAALTQEDKHHPYYIEEARCGFCASN